MKNLSWKAKENKFKIIVYIVAVLLSGVVIFLGNRWVYNPETMFLGGYDDGACTATVTEILHSKSDDVVIDGQVIGTNSLIIFNCKITNGEQKGETVMAYESISAHDTVPLEKVQKGDKILITATFSEGEDDMEWVLYDYDRSMPLWILGIMFVAVVLIFGRMKGVNTLISLGYTCVAVFAVFLPAVLSGHNIYLWSILTCVYIIIMTLIITNGINKKTLAAVIGCTSGVIVSGLLTVISTKFLNLTGITGEDTVYIKQNFDIDLNALIFAGIILGSVGAVMDVSVSISSALKELHEQVEKPTFGGLFKSGITIGRDIMGTMANTLVLAYIGCEMSATLLSVVYSSSLTTLFSREKIVEELLQALVGSIGLLLTIPLTAFVSAALYMSVGKFIKTRAKTDTKYDKYYVEPSSEPSLFEHTDDSDLHE
jgi:uncharacterized membrane protein